jgi:DNA-binding GntR family transcriptional regulator
MIIILSTKLLKKLLSLNRKIDPKLTRQKKRDHLFLELRERIINGHYSPGMKLIEQDLAEEFGLKRLAVREGLRDLMSQGLVEKRPNKGAIVRRMDTTNLFEVMEIREVLEGLAARLAAQKSKREDWLDLDKEFGGPFERIVNNLDFNGYFELISRFRERMVKAAQNEELSKLIDSLYAKVRIVQKRILILPGRVNAAMEEHRAVLKAIMAGDPGKAEEKKRKNMRQAREWLRKYQSWLL